MGCSGVLFQFFGGTGPPWWAKQPTSSTVPEMVAASAGGGAAGGGARRGLAQERVGVAAEAAHAHAGDDVAAAGDGDVHPHAVVEVVVGHRHAQRHDAALAGAVRGHVGLAVAGAGADVDDGAAARARHVRDHLARHQVGALEVHVEDALEQRFLGGEHGAQRTDGGVVDQAVDGAVA